MSSRQMLRPRDKAVFDLNDERLPSTKMYLYDTSMTERVGEAVYAL